MEILDKLSKIVYLNKASIAFNSKCFKSNSLIKSKKSRKKFQIIEKDKRG